ncbi:MAG: hypothetical protein SGJ18_14450 [Pseudomonadota bacterium]|nr:hypothetical protein [Pseudomonadota bacterium]
MKLFESSEKISAIENPVDWTPEKNTLFYKSCEEMANFHYKNNHVIRHLYDRHGFDPNSIKCESDVARIPSVSVTAMKYHLLTTLPHTDTVLRLTSSGTRGQKTQIWFDQQSLDRVQKMLDVYFEQLSFVSNIPNNYMIFNYDPDDAGDLGIAFTEKNQMRFAPIADSFFAIKKDSQGSWYFDKEKVMAKLRKFENEKKPIRIFAMPAFLFEFLNWMRVEGHQPLKFSSESWIMTGGGWKAAEDKKITREAFRIMCQEAFGIPLHQQRDAFGMAEHCAPYFECAQHRFHIPVFNRIIIRDPLTMTEVPKGESGLMEFVTPFNAMMPTLSILSTDYGRIRSEACDCGGASPTFEILGRAGTSKHKGCALTASEIVRRV